MTHPLLELRIIVSPALPIKPTLAQDTVRSVRHGLADVLKWLGEDVGPVPGALIHMIRSGGNLYVSAEMSRQLGGVK